eukprot:Hpha_TRINITY_DN17010_c3_g1::TRINITY_DN17010_c3_g1_i8::g.166240::m.166240
MSAPASNQYSRLGHPPRTRSAPPRRPVRCTPNTITPTTIGTRCSAAPSIRPENLRKRPYLTKYGTEANQGRQHITERETLPARSARVQGEKTQRAKREVQPSKEEMERLRQEVRRLSEAREEADERARELERQLATAHRRLREEGEEVERLQQEVTRLREELQAKAPNVEPQQSIHTGSTPADEEAGAFAAETKYERPDHGELKRLLGTALEKPEAQVRTRKNLRPDVLNQGNALFRVEGLEEEVSVEHAVARAVGCMQGYIVCPQCDCALTEDKKPKHLKHHEKKGLGEPQYVPISAEWYLKAARSISAEKEAIAIYSMEGPLCYEVNASMRAYKFQGDNTKYAETMHYAALLRRQLLSYPPVGGGTEPARLFRAVCRGIK